MNSRLIMSTAILGPLLLAPLHAGAQLQDCEDCDEHVFWEEVHGVVKHQFPDEGAGVPYWCGALTEDAPNVPGIEGPALFEGDCESCHLDWIEGMCMFHDPCWSEDETALLAFEANVGQLVSALSSGSDGPSARATRELAVGLALIPSLTVDRTQAQLLLHDCQGRLITRWNLPILAVKRLTGQ